MTEPNLLNIYSFNLPGISCCGTAPVEKQLLSSPYVKSVDFDLTGVEVKVIIKTSTTNESVKEELVNHLKKAGVRVRAPHWLLATFGIGGGFILMYLASIVTSFPVTIALTAVSIISTLALGMDSYKRAIQGLFKKSPDLTMDTLLTISTLTMIIVLVASFFVSWLPVISCYETLLVFGFRYFGFWLDDSIKERISTDRTYQDSLPEVVTIIKEDTDIKKSLIHVKIGDVLLIKPGDLIPVDGEYIGNISPKAGITQNSCVIDDLVIEGKSLDKQPGAYLLSGMRLAKTSFPIKLRATKAVQNSHLAIIDAKNKIIRKGKAPIQTTAARILKKYFIPTVLFLALTSGVMMSLFASPAVGVQCFIAVLMCACPCTYWLITPIAMKFGMRKAEAHGLSFASPKQLEMASNIDIVVFDLHGTLTTGKRRVTHYVRLSNDSTVDDDEIWSQMLALEDKLSDSIGSAMTEYLQQKPLKKTYAVKNRQRINYGGVQGFIEIAPGEEKSFIIGNRQVMEEHGIFPPSEVSLSVNLGETIIYLASVQKIPQLLGALVLEDKLREDTQATIKQLKRLGKEIHICTAADKETALRHAKMLDIPAKHVVANCGRNGNISDKANYISQLQAKNDKGIATKNVAMIGDTINDSEAFNTSCLSVSIQSGLSETATLLEAGGVISKGKLFSLVNGFSVAQQTIANIKQNFLLSLGYNIFAMSLAGGGLVSLMGCALNPGIGALLMIAQSVLILANTYRFGQERLDLKPLDSSLPSYKQSPTQRSQGVQPVSNTYSSRPKESYEKQQRGGLSLFLKAEEHKCQANSLRVHEVYDYHPCEPS